MRAFVNRAARGLLAALVAFAPLTAHAFETEMLQQTGAADRRVNIIVLGDGYRTSDQTKLTNDATALLNVLWSRSAYGSYRDYFNVKLVHTVSSTNGAVGGSDNPSPDTIFGSYFWCAGIERLICVEDQTALWDAVAADAPEYDSNIDIVMLLVNDSKYGGSGGSIAVASTNSASGEVAVHEIGHSFASLADEYSSAASYPPCEGECPEPNASLSYDRNTIKWSYWIEPSTPLPTTGNSDLVGAYEGARYQTTGVYRPWDSCLMRSTERPLCPVCSEVVVRRIHDKVSPLQGSTPEAESVLVPGNTTQTFGVERMSPDPDTVDVRWFLDDEEIGTGDELELDTGKAEAGTYTLEARLADTTSMVRSDPEALLQDSRAWQVTLEPSLGGSAGSGGSAGAGGSAGGGGLGGGGLGGGGLGGSTAGSGSGGLAGSEGTPASGAGGLAAAGSGGAVTTPSATPAPPPPEVVGQCGCRQPGGSRTPPLGWVMLAALGLALGRRRNRAPAVRSA
jgi:hypothetical protein